MKRAKLEKRGKRQMSVLWKQMVCFREMSKTRKNTKLFREAWKWESENMKMGTW